MNQGTNLGSQIGRWIILAALVVALGALLLTIRPLGAQSDGAPQLTIVPPNTVEHNENDGGPVYTFVATDPEGKTIFWTLSGTDADDFMIDNGVLQFKNAPDYEIPLDDTTENTPDTETTTDATTSDGIYEVTVRFSDGGNAAEHSMKVEVQDVEEDGMIMLSPIQPQVGTPLQAVIIDLDGVTTNTSFNPQATYVWSKSDTMTGTYTDIPGATQETYTPTMDDEGDYLRATVTYIEHASTRPAKTAVGTATLPVRADTHMNVAPAVPTEGQGQMRIGGTGTDEAIIRYIAEDAAVGDNVGPPVTAVDDNVDLLTYSLGPVAEGDADPTPAQIAEAAPFDIDAATGQITTNRVLDFDETVDSPVDPGAGVLYTVREVVVTATDPDGEELSIRVDIRVTDVDEAPLFADGLTREAIVMEQPTAVTTDDSRHIGTYTAGTFASDPDNPTATFTADNRGIGGDDADAFDFDGETLQFTDDFVLDYENPGDANEDNLYELTVTATDATGMTSSLSVTVKVTNDPTDDDVNAAGMLEIFNRQPEVNTLLDVTGPPTDPDGGVRAVRYQWYWSSATGATLGTPATCTAFDPAFDPDIPGTAGDPDLNSASPWMKIDGATSRSYMPTLDRVDDYDTTTPRPADRELAMDAFDCLMVRASYLDDGPRSADDSSTTEYDESRQYAYAVSEFSVQNEDKDNVAPEFQDGDTALAGIQVRPRIQENFPQSTDTDPTQMFSAVVLATEAAQASTPGDFLTTLTAPTEGVIRILDGTFPDDDNDGVIEADDGTYAPDDFPATGHKLTFSISGDDENFELEDKATGVINFTASPDYEVLSQRRYTVTLTAHDPTNATDSITIIVDVENIDEPPTFDEGEAEVDFAENGTGTVETYTANDPESDRYFWGLDGTDAALFDIGVIDGRLTFRNAPNFEDPEDVENTGVTPNHEENDNVYNVVVHLLMDGESLTDTTDTPEARMMAVAVTVTDVAEAPVFTKTTDDNDNIVPTELNIAENKHPDTMLNRAVENSPQASDEDEIPEDDMYASVALVYTISGTGTEALSIVPATGELRTTRVLDYESGDRSFEVTVTATDPTDMSDSIELIINVTDEDEAPVGGGTNQAPVFASSTMTRSVAENTAAGIDIGEPITATDPQDQTIEYTLGGADASHFDIDMAMGQLKTKGALDYESKDTYTVTVTATDDDATSPMSDETTVTVMVTDESELGTLAGNGDPTYAEDRTDAVETYTVSGGTMDDMATWTVSGDDADAFTIPGGALTFNSQPDFEDPMGGADNDSNTYMVTVMAEAGGEMKMMDVSVMVANAMERGTLSLDPTRPSVGTPITVTLEDPDIVVPGSENYWWGSADTADGNYTNIDGATLATYTPVADDAGKYLAAWVTWDDGYAMHDRENDINIDRVVTETAVSQLAVNGPDAVDHPENTTSVATYEASGADGATVAWSLVGDDFGVFNVTDGRIIFLSAPDYEAMDSADGDNMYNVTVVATANGNMATHDLTVTVTNVDEDGSITGLPASSMEGAELTAVLEDDDGATNTAWQWARDGANIADATSATYTVVAADVGMSLMVTATYDDVHGTGKMVSSAAVMIAADTVSSYDTNGTAGIQIDELFRAIDDYFENGLSISELFEVIDAYFM